MLLGGDEFRRTQRGNNNPYCQDNETSWVDWSLRQRNDEIVRFARNVFALRRAHPVLRREAFYTGDDIQWFDPSGKSPDWSDSRPSTLACLIRSQDGPDLYLMFSAAAEPISFVLPPSCRAEQWRLVVDTAQRSPRDFCAPEEEAVLNKVIVKMIEKLPARIPQLK